MSSMRKLSLVDTVSYTRDSKYLGFFLICNKALKSPQKNWKEKPMTAPVILEIFSDYV
jgi:hypothetical protein